MRPIEPVEEVEERKRIASHSYGEALEKERLRGRRRGFGGPAPVLGDEYLASAPPSAPAYLAPEQQFRTDVAAELAAEQAAKRAADDALLQTKRAARARREAAIRGGAAAREGVGAVESVGSVLSDWGAPPASGSARDASGGVSSTVRSNHNAPGMAYDIVSERYLASAEGDKLRAQDEDARRRWASRAQALADRDSRSGYNPITGAAVQPVRPLPPFESTARGDRYTGQ
ncbi:uncharacterized protein AMSG_02314 [Thecamonas trahens ATCC 50062]|uniref:Uncharacterized protein n=1 Tax=Thecamonas trahens ATCC 50062 TaxID=461836 RepID=A0A0L0DXT3_THETB|nr:hypothetical protein AMSG_02314 [Thecamonas trahens ATCC 50062]KNC56343.1 hypothetical protein AMSG_02314 [Thecamonas trahens ATCC 50062]|eukprot:XP_013760860.1 hypothetical protein AMSG_02314 [Thecamonas trahens ATCC 50062]